MLCREGFYVGGRIESIFIVVGEMFGLDDLEGFGVFMILWVGNEFSVKYGLVRFLVSRWGRSVVVIVLFRS